MCIKEQEPNEYVNIEVLDHNVSDCFLAAIMMYVRYLHNENYDLLQFSWYFSYEESFFFTGIRLINYSEIQAYVWNRYGISMSFFNDIDKIDVDKLVKNELASGKPVGVTVDYKSCSWTKGTYGDRYIYHFILIIGCSDDCFWCIDNEVLTLQILEKKKAFKMIREVLCFRGSNKLNRAYNFKMSFLSKDYCRRREGMLTDIDSIKKVMFECESINDIYSISSKLKLIAGNYHDFGLFLKEINDYSNCNKHIENIEHAFSLLSVLCLKLASKKNLKTCIAISKQIEIIKFNELELRRVLKGSR